MTEIRDQLAAHLARRHQVLDALLDDTLIDIRTRSGAFHRRQDR
ncbi:hypothetical protein [Nonomuraea turkmeniaca]|nr:hypothetical protein [Nonomuraea turkmeniaca]